MVSTSDLAVTQGRILHQLTARALIRDWIEGSLAEDRTQHEVWGGACGCGCGCVVVLGEIEPIHRTPPPLVGVEEGTQGLHHQYEQRVLHSVSIHQFCGH